MGQQPCLTCGPIFLEKLLVGHTIKKKKTLRATLMKKKVLVINRKKLFNIKNMMN